MLYATRDELEIYLKRIGKRGEQTLSTLGKLQPFVACMQSELGFAMLSELAGRYEDLLDKVSELKATDDEKVEFRVIKRMLIDFSTKINLYNRNIGVIKEASEK